ncbi:LLM class flavin-dependent oxidoreductase [Streptomyces sp. V4I2]|uniref:LLM class flavin-dependent oxidoreductase n=1 Tax=Streptomyces sp. V4I2 TaxID=3042280 RepID=UPI002784862B|nr:LLM class flavin-dependent oxidoreductase [Streptomyces sp. V4I2]MDQ1045006.1 F420-dependent oxidoreductase-like protein [Streptomyces sp. V4I2]
MRIGVAVAYWPWFRLREQIEVARLADELGLDSVWVSETWGQEAVALLGHLTAVTHRIRLGAAVLQIPARQPTTVATAAVTLHDLSGGRVMLGLGLSGPQISEGWYGVPFSEPLARTREYIEVIRGALSGKPVDHQGTQWTIPAYGQGLGQGMPLKLLALPTNRRIPLFLGVSGAKTVEQAGALADGWLPFLFSAAHAEELTAPLLRGIEKAGRSRSDVEIAPIVPAALADDLATARNQIRPFIAFYLGGMGSPEKNFYVDLAERYGHGASARACQERFLAGDRRGAASELSDALIDLISLPVTDSTLAAGLDRYAATGADTLITMPFGDRSRLLRALASHMSTDISQ